MTSRVGIIWHARGPALHRDDTPSNTEAVQAVKTAVIRQPMTVVPVVETGSQPQTPNGRGPLGYRVHSVAQGVMTPSSVVLTGIPSHSPDCLLRLARSGARDRQRSEAVTSRQVQIRLSPSEVDRLVAAYQGGRRTIQLAAEFGVHRNTVRRLLHTRGLLLTGPLDRVSIRMRGVLYPEADLHTVT
jgi:hypothetical protein